MECMNKCGTTLTGRQKRFCSDKCRKAQSRTKPDTQQAAERPNSDKRVVKYPDKAGQTKPGHESRTSAEQGVNLDTCSDSILEQHFAATKPANYGLDDCECQHCKTNRVNGNKHTINHGAYKSANELGEHELNRVSLPGDVDYTGVAKEG